MSRSFPWTGHEMRPGAQTPQSGKEWPGQNPKSNYLGENANKGISGFGSLGFEGRPFSGGRAIP